MEKNKKLIIIGDSSFAEIAYQYFSYDSAYEVCGFSVERAYLKKNLLFGLPVIPFEDLTRHYDPLEFAVYVAIVYTQLNRLRTRLYVQAKRWGYQCASYISPKAFVWPNVTLGEHCFIFENNVIQPFVQLNNNIVLWSGNHIGHHSTIQDNCFIASHVVISGHCTIGENCFLGVNSTLADQITLGADTLVGAGALILKDASSNLVYKSRATEPHVVTSRKLFKVSSVEDQA